MFLGIQNFSAELGNVFEYGEGLGKEGGVHIIAGHEAQLAVSCGHCGWVGNGEACII